MHKIYNCKVISMMFFMTVVYGNPIPRKVRVRVDESLRNLQPVWCDFNDDLNRRWNYNAHYDCNEVYSSTQNDITKRITDLPRVLQNLRRSAGLICRLQSVMFTNFTDIANCCSTFSAESIIRLVMDVHNKLLQIWWRLRRHISQYHNNNADCVQDPSPSVSYNDMPGQINNAFMAARIILNSIEAYPENFRNNVRTD